MSTKKIRELYHFTDKKLYDEVISKEGLSPQELNKPSLENPARECGIDVRKGIWMWLEVTDELISDFFLFQKIAKGMRHGVLLKCKVEDKSTLSGKLADKPTKIAMVHHLNFENSTEGNYDRHKNMHNNIPFDIAMDVIPPENIVPVAEIKEVLNKLLDKF